MRFWGFNHKIDKALAPFLKLNTKKRFPMIICCSNPKPVREKLLCWNGLIKYEYGSISAIACELAPHYIEKIAYLPEVRYVCHDHAAMLCMRKTNDLTGTGQARLMNLTGKGIGIALVDTGVYPHPDLVSDRHVVKVFKDYVNCCEKPYDDNGHGTFLCGCISSSGLMSDRKNAGIAPGASLFVIKAFNETGIGKMSDIMAGIEEIIRLKAENNIHILCLPFELQTCMQMEVNPLGLEIEKASEAGLIVVAPSGNSGPYPYSISFPGSHSDVITVGGVDTKRNTNGLLQTARWSGRGPTMAGLAKPDFVAPCTAIVSLATDKSYKPGIRRASPPKDPYTTGSGTSIACAVACGHAALLLERTPSLTPMDVKSLFRLSTLSLGESKFSQGTGIYIFNKSQESKP